MCLKDPSLNKNESSENSNKNDSSILSEETSVDTISEIITDDDEEAYADHINWDVFKAKIDADKLTAHLASSGMAGIAAATAISSSRSRNKPYAFETIPAVRKRQATRLMRKLMNLVDEYSVRVGQQMVVLVCNPRVAHKSPPHLDSPTSSTFFKAYGSSPLENVIRNMRPIISQELDTALRNYQVLHEQSGVSNSLWSSRGSDSLPPLMVEGIPTPLDKMTQAQLRAFIPVMLKYSTNRGKPGWGRPHARPPWWPEEVPWANVRSDVRTSEEKAQVSWTSVLKKVVRRCYEYHGREDLLHDYTSGVGQQSGMVNSTQMMDMNGQGPEQQGSYMLASGSVNDVNDPNRSNMYTMNIMHMPTSEGMSNSGHFASFAPQTYSFKTENDGSISIIPYDDSQKPPEVASMEAAAALDEYNVENVKYNTGESIGMQSFTNGGEMVSLPPESVMQLDNDATATLYHIIANNSRLKSNQMVSTPGENVQRTHENM